MDGILNKLRCYLIGSMEFSNGQPWRNYTKEQLQDTGIIFFDPYHKPFLNSQEEDDEARKMYKDWISEGKYDQVSEFVKRLRADDLRLCDISDFFIVQINPLVPSWGSAEELTTINRAKKPIFMYVEGGKKKCPLWIFGMIPHKYIYDSLDDVINVIKKINSGEKQIDSDRWHILKPEYR